MISRGNKMKILVVLPYSPFPVKRGTGRLMMSLIEGLSVKHEVILVTMTFSIKESRVLEEVFENRVLVRPMVAPNKSGPAARIYYRLKNMIMAVFAGIPIDVSYAAPGKFLEFIRANAEKEKVDMVLASYWHLYRLPSLLPSFRNILLTHDVDFLIKPERVAPARSIFECIFRRYNSFLKARIEKKAYRAFDAILTVTSRDAEELGRTGVAAGKKIHTLPLAIDLVNFAPSKTPRNREKILITGTFHSDFNDDALRFFIREVFPAVLERRPAARLQVVGEGVRRNIVEKGGENIEFSGYIEDIRACLAGCSMLVLPLRFAGGVRIRMMEAAAMAVPVVSTPAGVGGMGLVAGREYQEATGAAEMADRIVTFLEDPGLAARTGLNARRWAEQNISMENYAERLDRLISGI